MAPCLLPPALQPPRTQQCKLQCTVESRHTRARAAFQVHGGSPWGAGTLAGPDGSRAVSDKEKAFAKASVSRLRP